MEFTESTEIIRYDKQLVLHKDLTFINSKLAFDSSFNLEIEKVPNYPNFIDLAKFSSLVYENSDIQEKRLIGGWINGWTLLTTATNTNLNNGYFGAAYYHPNNKHVVIAHRGTVYNSPKKFNQNVLRADLFGIVLNEEVPQINSAATFTHIILEILSEYSSSFCEATAYFEIFITGHSLGGWLAQLTAFTSKYLRLKNEIFERNDKFERFPVQTIVYDSPGCRNGLLRLQEERYPTGESPISTMNITTYISGPSRINSINEHVGTIYEISRNLNDHSIDLIIEELQRIQLRSNMLKVVDWPMYQFMRSELSIAQRARDNKKRNFVAESSRYKTETVNENECSINVFTKTEQKFLFVYKLLRDFPFPSLSEKIDIFVDSSDAEIIRYKLSSYDINNYTFRLQLESQSLDNFIPFLRLVSKLYPVIFVETIKAINSDEIIKSIYQQQSSIFIASYIKNFLLNFDTNNDVIIESFEGDLSLIRHIPTYDTRMKINKIYQKLQTLDKYKNDNLLTILELKQLLFIHEAINLKQYLATLKDHLLIIECKKSDALYFDLPIQKLLRDVKAIMENNENFIKIIFVTHVDDTGIDKYLKEILQLDKCDVNDSFKWTDLSNETKKRLLEIKVNFQGEENVSLKDLFESNNESNHDLNLNDILDYETIICLIDEKSTNKNISTIGMNIKLFNNFETTCYKIFDELPKNNLLKLLDSNKNVFFIGGMIPSRLTENNLMENLMDGLNTSERSRLNEKINEKLFIFSKDKNPTEEFERLCNDNLNKIVYWVDQPTSESILCLQVFCRNFYFKREFNYMNEIVLDGNIVNELINDKLTENYVFVNAGSYEMLKDLFIFRTDRNKQNFENNFKNNKIKIVEKC